ncbi:hypothetical protein LINPERPRIM_LOCUS21538 [Linum perenne]
MKLYFCLPLLLNLKLYAK